MGRSGYTDDGGDSNFCYLWGSIVARAAGGKRGQKLFRDLAAALDGLPEKRLVSGSFLCKAGEVCTLGALGKARGLDMRALENAAQENLDDDRVEVARPAGKAFGVAFSLAAEVMYQNDEAHYGSETPEERWQRMRYWVARNIEEAKP